jgi:pimeloyl-ACP methyl ester carboxylesterase
MRVRGVDLTVRDSGRGLPLLWGHGLMGSIAQEDEAGMLPWQGLDAPDSGVRLLRWDARGHGVSEATLDPDQYRWSALGADALALAEAMGCERAVFGGVSMGAATALHAAVEAPDRVAGLVLMAPPTAWDSRPRQARIYHGSARLVDWIGLRPFSCLGALFARAVPNKGLAAIQRSVMRGLRRADPRAVTAALRGAAASDLPDPERLRELREVPCLILAWTHDPSHPLSTAEQIAELLPDASLHVASNMEEIREWKTTLRGFLDALGSGSVQRAS